MGDLVEDTVGALSRYSGRELPPVEYELAIEDRESPFPWRVRSVVIDEELSGAYKATIEIECEGPDASAEPLLGAPACLTLRRAGRSERRFPGLIRAVVSQGRDFGEVEHCTVELEPAFTCLDEGLTTRRFQDATVPSILREVLREGLGRYAREAVFHLSRVDDDGQSGRDTRETFPSRPWCVQYAESTHDFARRIMAEEGLSYYFETNEGHEKLVIVDGNFAFPTLADRLELRAPGGMAIDREVLTAFSVRQSRSAGRVTLRAANLTSPAPEIEARSRPPEREEHRPVRPAVDAGAEELYDPGSGATLFRYKRGAYERDDLETQARLRLEERRSGREIASGAGNVLALRPGLVVDVEAGATLRGKYLITRVRHAGHGPSLHRTGGTSAGGYDNEFEAIPAGIPFRPARMPKPVARGLDRAVVTAPHDNPLWTEQHGRVTVRFLWDRDDDGPPDMTSYWVPVATNWAGPGYGVHFLPRAGMEVIVGYVGNDPDQPIVLGCRESARNTLPVELPRDAGKSGIFTQSLREGGHDHEHWSELSFDDEAGREKVTLRAGWDFERRVLHDDRPRRDPHGREQTNRARRWPVRAHHRQGRRADGPRGAQEDHRRQRREDGYDRKRDHHDREGLPQRGGEADGQAHRARRP